MMSQHRESQPRASDGLSRSGQKKAVEFNKDQFGPPDIEPAELNYIKKVGGGCFGNVFLGECRGIKVAIKKLFKQDLNSNSLNEFKKEVEFCSRLNHPNVLLFMGACTVPGEMAIVMELCDNGNLEQLLHNDKTTLSLYRRLMMAKDTAVGMNWLHCSNPTIIHRDLKPSNLLIDKHGQIKVCDFGLSAIKPDNGKLQDEKSIPGTPLWMAPEVMMGRPLDEKSDVYSYAIVLWEIVTQKIPFPNMKSFVEFRHAICFQNVRPPVDETILPSIRNLLELCWHKDPELRPSFAEIIKILDVILVDAAIKDLDGRELWKNEFLGREEVSFSEFLVPFKKIIGREIEEQELECLQLLIGKQKKDNLMNPGESIVSIETFGSILDSFGPLKAAYMSKGRPVTAMDRITRTCKQHWFHGDISKPEAETLLRQYREGYYLIRISATVAGCFTISRVTPQKKIVHQRIEYKPNQGFTLSYKSNGNPKTIKSLPEKSLRSFVRAIKSEFFLEAAAPSSRYRLIFQKVRSEAPTGEDSGYDPDNILC